MPQTGCGFFHDFWDFSQLKNKKLLSGNYILQQIYMHKFIILKHFMLKFEKNGVYPKNKDRQKMAKWTKRYYKSKLHVAFQTQMHPQRWKCLFECWTWLIVLELNIFKWKRALIVDGPSIGRWKTIDQFHISEGKCFRHWH